MKVIRATFEKESGHRLKVIFGSSGKIYAQIINGAPFDIFLSADQKKPKALVENGLAHSQERFIYAIGQLVLWSPIESLVDNNGKILTKISFDKLAIANSKLAPYGMASVEVIKNLGLYEKLKDKILQGENVTQTQQFIVTGNVKLGFIGLSQVVRDEKITHGSTWLVPQHLYEPILQDGILLKRGEKKLAARAFADYLKTKKVKTVIKSFGYKVKE